VAIFDFDIVGTEVTDGDIKCITGVLPKRQRYNKYLNAQVNCKIKCEVNYELRWIIKCTIY